jgi:hypothetical protein
MVLPVQNLPGESLFSLLSLAGTQAAIIDLYFVDIKLVRPWISPQHHPHPCSTMFPSSNRIMGSSHFRHQDKLHETGMQRRSRRLQDQIQTPSTQSLAPLSTKSSIQRLFLSTLSGSDGGAPWSIAHPKIT